MNYKERYPDAKSQVGAYHEGYIKEDICVDNALYYTGRYFACSVCKEITPFVDHLFDRNEHICSDECREESIKNYYESTTPEVEVVVA